MESKLERRREKTGGGCVGTQLRDGGGLYQQSSRGDEGMDFKCSGSKMARTQ